MAIIDLTWARIAHANFWLDGGALSKRGLSGKPQVVAIENRIWQGVIEFPAMTPVQARHMAAAGDRLAGVANALRIAVPTGSDEGGLLARSVVDVDRALDLALPGAPDIDAALAPFDPVTAAVGSVGSSSLQVAGDGVLRLRVGAFFSIGDRLYRVAELSSGMVEFNPPLRAPVALGARLRAVRPTVALRLSKADGWRVLRDYGRNGRPMSIEVEEAFDA